MWQGYERTKNGAGAALTFKGGVYKIIQELVPGVKFAPSCCHEQRK